MHAKTQHVAPLLLARATSIVPAVVVQRQLPTTHSRFEKLHHATAFPPPFNFTCSEHLCRPQQQ
jgi:hypothetical protein